MSENKTTSVARLRILAAMEKMTIFIEKHDRDLSEMDGEHLKSVLGALAEQAGKLEYVELLDASMPGVADQVRLQQASASAMLRLVDEIISAADPAIPMIFDEGVPQ